MVFKALINFILHCCIASNCRFTPWMSTDYGGSEDNELLSKLTKQYGNYACQNPVRMDVRRKDTKEKVPLTKNPQYYASFDTVNGFQCMKSQQSDLSDCFDYEVQLCCPGKSFCTIHKKSQ